MTERTGPEGRPFVHLNCAISADGRLAHAQGRRARLSGPEDLQRVHELRSRLDAILVGVGTVRMDDPSLTVHWKELGRPPGREPLRIVLDTFGRIPRTARVLATPPATLVATAAATAVDLPAGVEHFRAGSGAVDLPALLRHLKGRGVASLLVEGGATVIASFVRGGLFDVFTVYVAPVLIGGSTAPPMVGGSDLPGEATVPMNLRSVDRLGEGLVITYGPGPRGAKGRGAGEPGGKGGSAASAHL